MFEGIPSPAQAMLWLAIIEAAGFTAFTALAILPLVKTLREQIETADRRHHEQMDILIRLLARDAKFGKEQRACKGQKNDENHAASRSPDANRPLPGDNG